MRRATSAAPWTLVAPILLIVAAFLIGGGGFAYWGFTSKGATGRYGSVSIPGRAVLDLPARTVDITYAEDLVNQVIDVPAFGISVVSVSTNQQVAVHFHDGSASGINGVSYVPVGTAAIPAAGRYVVDISGGSSGAPNPRLAFGIGTQHTTLLIAALVTAGVLLLLSAATLILRRRSRTRQRMQPAFTDF